MNADQFLPLGLNVQLTGATQHLRAMFCHGAAKEERAHVEPLGLALGQEFQCSDGSRFPIWAPVHGNPNLSRAPV